MSLHPHGVVLLPLPAAALLLTREEPHISLVYLARLTIASVALPAAVANSSLWSTIFALSDHKCVVFCFFAWGRPALLPPGMRTHCLRSAFGRGPADPLASDALVAQAPSVLPQLVGKGRGPQVGGTPFCKCWVSDSSPLPKTSLPTKVLRGVEFWGRWGGTTHTKAQHCLSTTI